MINKNWQYEVKEADNADQGQPVKSGLKKGDAQRDMSVTTDEVCELMMRLLRENDNSDNAFDDSFWIGKLLANLGKLSKYEAMKAIALELLRQFNLDHIGKFSPQYAVTKGAVKGYFNMRKQIFAFRQSILPNLETRFNNEFALFQDQIKDAELVLDRIGAALDSILANQSWPLEIRVFIFDKKVKNRFLFTEPLLANSSLPSNFLATLQSLLDEVKSELAAQRFAMAEHQLQSIALFLEQNHLKKLNFREALEIDDAAAKSVLNGLWQLMAYQPHCLFDQKLPVFCKRIFSTVFFGSSRPACVEFEQLQNDVHPYQNELDEDWFKSELQLQNEADRKELLNQNLGNENGEMMPADQIADGSLVTQQILQTGFNNASGLMMPPQANLGFQFMNPMG